MEGYVHQETDGALKLQTCHVWKALLINMMCRRSDDGDEGDLSLPAPSFIADTVDVYLLHSLEGNRESTLDQLLCDLETIKFPPSYLQELCESCCSFLRGAGDIHSLHTIMTEFEDLFDPKGPSQPPLLHPLSLCGVYLRDILSAFHNLPFELTCQLLMLCQEEVKHSDHVAVVRSRKSCFQGLTPAARSSACQNSSEKLRHVVIGSSPVLVHSEDQLALADYHAELGGISSTLPSSTPIRHIPAFASLTSVPAHHTFRQAVGLQSPSAATPVTNQLISGLSRVATPPPSLSTGMHRNDGMLSNSGSFMVQSRLSLAGMDADASVASAGNVFAFALPSLENPMVFAKKVVQEDREAKVQKIADELFLAQQRRDWVHTVKLHHDLFDMTLPGSDSIATSPTQSDAESRRCDTRKAIRHCGLATRELACAAADVGYRHEAVTLRNKAVQMALMTDDRESQLWALSDVLASIHPSSKEVDVYSQQLQTKAEDITDASVGHLPHLWRSWHALYQCNKPMHLVLDEWTQGWAVLLEDHHYQYVPQYLSFLSWSYRVFAYSSCSQVLSQMLMVTALKNEPQAHHTLTPKAKVTLANVEHIRHVISQLVTCSMGKGDHSSAVKLLEYDDMCEQLMTWPVQLSQTLSVQRCEVFIETSLLKCQWEKARHWIEVIRVHNPQLSMYYEAKLLHELDDICQARRIVKTLISELEQSFSRIEEDFDVTFTPLLLARSLLLLAKVLSSKSSESCQAKQLLNKCLALSKAFNLTTVHQGGILTLADLQLRSSSSKTLATAYRTLVPWLPQILACSSCLDQGKALLLLARILLNEQVVPGSGQDLKSVVELLEDCHARLEQCQAYKLLAQVFQWKCRVYQALGDRNSSHLAARKYSEVHRLICATG